MTRCFIALNHARRLGLWRHVDLPSVALIFGVACASASCYRGIDLVDPGTAVSRIDGQPLNAKKMIGLRDFDEGGCAISAPDSAGVVRGFAVPRKNLPFAMPAIQRNAKTGTANGRAAHVTLNSGVNTVSLSCLIPNTVTDEELAKAIKLSAHGRWKEILSNLPHARRLPGLSGRPALSREALELQTEVVASTSNGPPQCAYWEIISTCSCYTPSISFSYNAGTDTWTINIYFYYCDETVGDLNDLWYMIDYEFFEWQCGGHTPEQRDYMIQQYIEQGLWYQAVCADFVYQPQVTGLFSWSVIRSHALETDYDPYFDWAMLRSVLSSGLISLHSAITYDITLSNRIYSTPHHNYLVRCYVSPDYTTLKSGGCSAGANSRHVYGDGADIDVADSTNWRAIEVAAYGLSPRPCAEPWSWSHSHLHIDYRTDVYAHYSYSNCGSLAITPP